MRKQQYHHHITLGQQQSDLVSTPIYNSDRLATSDLLLNWGGRNFVAQPGSCPAHPHRQMKAVSVNRGRRGINRQLCHTVKGSDVSPTGTVEQSSEDQALVNKQGSLQAYRKTQTTHYYLYTEYFIYTAMAVFVVLQVNINAVHLKLMTSVYLWSTT